MGTRKGAKNVAEFWHKCEQTGRSVAKALYAFLKAVNAVARAALWPGIRGAKAAFGFGKKWVRTAGTKARAGVDHAVKYVKDDPRTVIEYSLVIIPAIVALGLVIHFLRPVVVGVVHAYFSDATKAVPLIVSLVALYVAWSNYRRGNSAMVRLLEVRTEHHSELGVNQNQMFARFEVWVKVLGIPLRNPHAVIHARTEFGTLPVPLSQFLDGKPVPRTGGALEKGMVAFYGLRSFDLNHGQRQMAIQTAAPEAEDVEIAIYSNGFFVKRFRLQWKPPLRTWIRKWNNWAAHANFKYLSRTRKKWGRPFFFDRQWIPRFKDSMFALEQFASSLKEEATGPPAPSKPWPPPGTQGGTMLLINPPPSAPPPPPPVAGEKGKR